MPRLRQLLTAACAVTVALNMTQCTQAPPMEQCARDTASAISPDTRISECTAVIESGNASNEDLATALMYRGIAYQEKGAPDSAIQDYDRAIRFVPDYAYAFLNRGATYADRGEYDRAIAEIADFIGWPVRLVYRLVSDRCDLIDRRLGLAGGFVRGSGNRIYGCVRA